ncbi:MAG: carboxylating nicotinate-nucleotide diphosphorylase [Candidatus Saganbacteria bacterium]|nr:carboxylating nicotinate-nucleotide diphosphorylase [Candidatus Saganbacteria bacterium]
MKNSKLQIKTRKLVKEALLEDVGAGDVTTMSIADSVTPTEAVIAAKETGVIAGLEAAREVFRQVDKRARFRPLIKDGGRVKSGKVIARVYGPAPSLLIAERTALNFLQRLSGIASQTSLFVAKVKGTRAKILDTRKTTPGLRLLEKAAVKAGGGTNHRIGLYDAILIKDNHIAMAGGVAEAIRRARAKSKMPVEIEAKTIAQVKQAIKAKADRILLDNMSLKNLRRAVKLCKKAQIKTEASGGVGLKTVRAIAKTGVDFISVGALTHSAKALDLSLKII